MIKEILIYPKDKDILTIKSEDVRDGEDISDLIQDLKDTLHSTEHGVGISAIQIGVPKKVCIIHADARDIVLINPVITRKRGEVDSQEGCLSVPEKYGVFKRPQKVWVDYISESGLKRELAEGGFVSRVVCHELDHMDGWCPVFDLAEKE